jgi:taurine dioxygenase
MKHMASNDWTITRLSGSLGAEVRGVDLTDTSDGNIAAIRAALSEHMVLFFPGQHRTVDEHIALGRPFGELEGHPNLKNADENTAPELFELRASQGGIADEWHTDITFQDEPALMSILHMVKCPAAGGDTMWSNLCAAYEALSEPMKEMCKGLTALHDAHPHDRADKMAIHPVVRKHPDTGAPALYVSEHFTRRIVELSSEESQTLLGFLTRHVQHPRFTVRYHWTQGTIGMWDNRCTQHHVLNDFDGERIIQRVTVMGDKPEGFGAKWRPYPESAGVSAMSRHDRQLIRFLRNGSA